MEPHQVEPRDRYARRATRDHLSVHASYRRLADRIIPHLGDCIDRGRTDMSADTVAKLEAELESLHATLEGMGKNSRGATDIFGRKFSVPVNAEHKATQDPLCVTLCNGSNPHMRGAQRRRHALAP